MAEVSVFDAYQVQRALRGHLAEDDAMEMLARDDATGVYWVLTRRELILVKDNRLGERIPRDRLRGGGAGNDPAVAGGGRSAAAPDWAVPARAGGNAPRMTLLAPFRKPNRLTRALAEIIGEVP